MLSSIEIFAQKKKSSIEIYLLFCVEIYLLFGVLL